jgi:DNA-binding CsgD family transcriptional regulator
VAAARTTARRLEDLASSTSNKRWVALAGAAAGRVAAAAGEERAAELLEAARQRWARLDLPFELARTRAELARLFAPDEPEVAAEHARRALALFEELGATVDADAMAELLRALGATPRAGGRGNGVLTGREQQVLRLLGAGLSNPEIAGRLHISRKTASHHVSRILSKLNLCNRAAAAAYAVSTLGPVRDKEWGI